MIFIKGNGIKQIFENILHIHNHFLLVQFVTFF
jgi:hypothetical protein